MASGDRHPGLIRWHYTVGTWFLEIVADGVIRTADTFVPKGERPAVWFSVRGDWEPIANKLLASNSGEIKFLDRKETQRIGRGLVRFGVLAETAPHDWEAYKQLSGATVKTVNALRKSAIKLGSHVGDWYCTFDPVPREKWHAVEVWHEEGWAAVPFDPVQENSNTENPK